MPLKKKLIKVGNSRMVAIPPAWLKYYEEESGQTIVDILMEVDNVITIRPYSEKRSEEPAGMETASPEA